MVAALVARASGRTVRRSINRRWEHRPPCRSGADHRDGRNETRAHPTCHADSHQHGSRQGGGRTVWVTAGGCWHRCPMDATRFAKRYGGWTAWVTACAVALEIAITTLPGRVKETIDRRSRTGTPCRSSGRLSQRKAIVRANGDLGGCCDPSLNSRQIFAVLWHNFASQSDPYRVLAFGRHRGISVCQTVQCGSNLG